MMLSLLAWGLPIGIGFFLGEWLDRDLLPARFPRFWLNLFIAPILGAAFASCLFFAWSLAFYPGAAMGVSLSVEAGLLLLLLGLNLPHYRKELRCFMGGRRPSSRNWVHWLLLGLVIGVFLYALLHFCQDYYQRTLLVPLGDWDGLVIWNMRARFLASGLEWRRGFLPAMEWTHPDYPLLLPAFIARLMLLCPPGAPVSALVGMLFYLAILGTALVALQWLKGWTTALIAATFMLAIFEESLTFTQYADIPLAAFFLLVILFAFLEDLQEAADWRGRALQGLLLGCLVWTKNEGWVLAGGWVVVRLGMDLWERKPSSRARLAGWGGMLIALAPFVLISLAQKVFLAPPNDILQATKAGDLLTRGLDLARWRLVARSLFRHILAYGRLRLPLIPLLAAYPMIAGMRFPPAWRKGLIQQALRLGLLGLLYFAVYLFTPKDLQWHIDTSMDRLITHLMPGFLLLCFLLSARLDPVEKLNNVNSG